MLALGTPSDRSDGRMPTRATRYPCSFLFSAASNFTLFSEKGVKLFAKRKTEIANLLTLSSSETVL